MALPTRAADADRALHAAPRAACSAQSLLFHFGILAVIGGHVLGILVPAGVTDAIGIDESAYHVISVTAGAGLAGAAATIGILILAARRVAVGRVRTATPRSDLVMYPLLLVTLLTGMAATFGDNLLFGEYHYRETVSPWFRGVLTFDPDPDLMAGAPFLFQAHAVSAWLLFAAWPSPASCTPGASRSHTWVGAGSSFAAAARTRPSRGHAAAEPHYESAGNRANGSGRNDSKSCGRRLRRELGGLLLADVERPA